MGNRSRLLLVAAAAAVLLASGIRAVAGPVNGAVLREDFSSETTDQTIATLVAYPGTAGRFFVDGSAVVVNGQLWLVNGPNNNDQLLLSPEVVGTGTISALVGADNSNGSYNVGLRIGQNNVTFHPGFGGAALRVEGPGGFGNTNVGFTPANGVMHLLEVASDGTGNFDVTLTDGANPANTFNASFTSPGSVGGEIGLRRSGQPVGIGMYDDLAVAGATETFDTSTAGGTSQVFNFVTSSSGKAEIDSGQLVLTSGDVNEAQTVLRSALMRDHAIIARLGASASNGSYNVGLRVGENNVVFHPGFAGGALRVEGPGGFGNTNVGFTPANGVAHELRVTSDGFGNFDLTLTDGTDSSNQFTTSWFNPGSIGGDFGPLRQGPTTETGFYDSLEVRIPNRWVMVAELFDVGADTSQVYPQFTEQVGTGKAFVVDGQMVLASASGGSDIFLTQPGPDGAFTISTLVGSDLDNGSFNVGLVVGGNQVVFHPGFGGGALRVEGTGGFGNTNVGFTPDNGVMHQLEVTSDGAGNFDLTLTDGANPANVFNASFSNPASVGGRVGLVRKGPTLGLGIFDDFAIDGQVQSFDVDNDAQALYPNFTASLSDGRALVDDGILVLAPQRDANTTQTFVIDAPAAEFELSALVGADNSAGGAYNVGLVVGENNIAFHPGYAAVPGAFRVEGPGGFGNTDLGFIPAVGEMHRLEVVSDGLGNFDVTLIDGADPTNVFTASWFNPGSVGGPIGFRRSGGGVGIGMFDNLIVTAAVPEPGTFVLLVLGGAALLALGRRKRSRSQL